MKKITYKSISSALTNKQLKNILGGSEGGGSGSCDAQATTCEGPCTTPIIEGPGGTIGGRPGTCRFEDPLGTGHQFCTCVDNNNNNG